MTDPKQFSFDERAQCAAYLRATHNMSQAEIGKVLGDLSQPQVSRLLAHAEQQHYLVIERRFAREMFDDDWLREIEQLLNPPQLVDDLRRYCTRAGVSLPRLRTFESGPGNTDIRLHQRRARFGKMAAGRIVELIQASRVVGVAWGRTIKSVLEGIQGSHLPIGAAHPIEFAAVCAELVSLAQSGHSSSMLASVLDGIFNAHPDERPQLTAFPAYIPARYDDAVRNSIRTYISDTAGYRRVFSGPEALIGRMDMLITSVGSANSPIHGSFDELVGAGEVDAAELRKMVLGDMAGILIPRRDLNAAQADLVNDLNEMSTGIRLEHVRAIAQRGFDHPNCAGVVVLALRSERADVVLELVRQQLVNELIIDHAAARALQELLSAELIEPGTDAVSDVG